MPPEAEHRVLAGGQPNIRLHDLKEWQGAAFDAENGRAAVRWVLPRTLELLAAGEELNTIDPALTLKRLSQTGFPDGYRPDEVELLHRFAVVWLLEQIDRAASGQDGMMLDDCLCMIASGGIDLNPVLSALDTCPVAGLVRCLSDGDLVLEPGFSTFWEDQKAVRAVTDWYTSDKLENRIIEFWADPQTPSDLCRVAERIADDIALRSGRPTLSGS